MDLATDDIMILDAWDQVSSLCAVYIYMHIGPLLIIFCLYQIYVWIGKEANEEEKTGVEKIGK